jgi:protease PrsW
VINAIVALLPVLLFLAALVFMDSFKLVPGRAVCLALVAGAASAKGAAALNGFLEGLGLSTLAISRYGAPVTEEALKALYVFYLVRRGRIGFLVDAAILGFAVGSGFAVVENLGYLHDLPERPLWLWIVRGFGPALIHGGCTAILAMITKAVHDRLSGRALGSLTFLPGLLVAVALHSIFNHFLLSPLAETLLLLVALPVLMVSVFGRSERATRAWLGVGLDTDLELLGSILSGSVLRTRVGAYLESLKSHLPGPVVADMLCLLRIQLELGIRAKGLLLAREAGFDMKVGDETRASLQELRYLEKAIGPTGLLAMKPILRRTSHDLWEIYLLEGG